MSQLCDGYKIALGKKAKGILEQKLEKAFWVVVRKYNFTVQDPGDVLI